MGIFKRLNESILAVDKTNPENNETNTDIVAASKDLIKDIAATCAVLRAKAREKGIRYEPKSKDTNTNKNSADWAEESL